MAFASDFTLDAFFDPAASVLIRFCGIPMSRIHLDQWHCRDLSFRMTSARSFTPKLPNQPLRNLLRLLEVFHGRQLVKALAEAATKAEVSDDTWRVNEAATLRVLADLAAIGWQFKSVKGNIYMVPKRITEMDPRQAKSVLREPLLAARNRQLEEPSTRRFLREMHLPRPGAAFGMDDLLDNGAMLASALRSTTPDAITTVVRPYIQFVDSAEKCEFTGHSLMDIWRYFRHTWSLEYRPTPGRTLNFLLRNSARPGHPVMGIIGLANAVFQLSDRDQWIGWTPEAMVKRVIREPEYWAKFRDSAIACLERAKGAIRQDDLMKEVGRTKDPATIIKKLEAIAHVEGERRIDSLKRDYQEAGEVPVVAARIQAKTKDGAIDWKKASETPLFKRKRAETLAEILFALSVLNKTSKEASSLLDHVAVDDHPDRTELRWSNPTLEKAVKGAVREMKKTGVASRILDVNVCGAAPAYRDILGGKLAALSLFSKEVQESYVHRYAASPSEIASSMAGRPVIKSHHICLLTTTSLYGVGSSQYNRLRMPTNGKTLEWTHIGETDGFGTVHMNRETVDLVREVATAKRGMRNVNNVFGEGTSPLMRQLREGLSVLGFEANDVLQHSNQRIVYATELYPGAREDLALDADHYTESPTMDTVAAEWTRRWLTMRVQQPDILSRTAEVTSKSVRAELGIE